MGPRRYPGHLHLGRLTREITEASKNPLPHEIHFLIRECKNHPRRNLSLQSAIQVTVKWQECSVCLSAEHEGDSVLHTSQHGETDPISFPPSCLVRCQRCRQHLPLLPEASLPACSRATYVLTGPVLASALALDPFRSALRAPAASPVHHHIGVRGEVRKST